MPTVASAVAMSVAQASARAAAAKPYPTLLTSEEQRRGSAGGQQGGPPRMAAEEVKVYLARPQIPPPPMPPVKLLTSSSVDHLHGDRASPSGSSASTGSGASDDLRFGAPSPASASTWSAASPSAAEAPSTPSPSKSGPPSISDVVRSISASTVLQGFLGPQAYLSLFACSTACGSPFRAYKLLLQGSPLARQLQTAAMRNDVEAAWIRLTDPSRPPSQKEKDAAMTWAVAFPRRRALAALLGRHGASRAGALELAFHSQAKYNEPSSMAHLTDTTSIAEQSASLRHMPLASDITAAVPPRWRALQIIWLLQAGDAMRFNERDLSVTVCTLDRFYATCRTPLPQHQLNSVMLAALSIEMKSAGVEASGVDISAILQHLSQGRETLPDIFRQEMRMLRRLNFAVGVPGPMCLLDGLSFRLCSNLEANGVVTKQAFAVWKDLAIFLLELAVFDTDLLYSGAQATLAAAALGVALFATGARLITGGAPGREAEEHEALLRSGLAACLDSYAPQPGSRWLRDREEKLLLFWKDCAGLNGIAGPFADCYDQLVAKHERSAWLQPHRADGGPAVAAAGRALTTAEARYRVLFAAPLPL